MDIILAISLITLLLLLTRTYYARRTLEHKDIESERTRPQIVHLNGFGKYIHVTITNSKPHPITPEKITVKKKLWGSIYFKNIPLTYKPIEEFTPTKNAQEALARFCKMPEYFISTQRIFLIELLEHIPGNVYKLCVTTTGGECQYIYHSPLEQSAAKTEADVGKE